MQDQEGYHKHYFKKGDDKSSTRDYAIAGLWSLLIFFWIMCGGIYYSLQIKEINTAYALLFILFVFGPILAVKFIKYTRDQYLGMASENDYLSKLSVFLFSGSLASIILFSLALGLWE